MSVISSEDIKIALGRARLLKDIENCNKELDKLPKTYTCYGLHGELDACWYAFRVYKDYQNYPVTSN